MERVGVVTQLKSSSVAISRSRAMHCPTEPALFIGCDRDFRFHMMFDPRPLSDWSQTLRELL
jgi:hypothetical protein